MTRARTTQDSATRHTAIIGNVAGMWSKMSWDVDVFRDIQSGYPKEQQPLAYAALNVCLAASSLEDWVINAIVQRERVARRTFDKRQARSLIKRAIPEQAALSAIANTAKHSKINEADWPGGYVSIDWEDGDEDFPPGYVLRHLQATQTHTIAINNFLDLQDSWWAFLRAQKLVADADRYMDWQQRKLTRIFGGGLHQLPPEATPFTDTST